MVQPAGKFYAQVNTGILRNADKESYGNTGVTLGARGTLFFGQGKDAIYGQAEAGAGTVMSAEATLGYERQLGKGFSLDVSGNASIDHSRTKTNNMLVEQRYTINANDKNGQPSQVTGNHLFITTWHPGQVKFNGRAMVKKNTSWGSFGAGLEAGYRTSTAPEINVHQEINYTDPNNQQREKSVLDMSKKPGKGAYATFVASADANLGKVFNAPKLDKFDIRANVAAGQEASIGLRYTF